ncbi:MAG: hypothetical protein LN412_04190 [Candidatus Thermoplasmatota archaeon]|nr:hypothetical protein [Candidatus Thermoplasmatota archaeon]
MDEGVDNDGDDGVDLVPEILGRSSEGPLRTPAHGMMLRDPRAGWLGGRREWHPGPRTLRRLLQEALAMTLVTALIGYEVSLAMGYGIKLLVGSYAHRHIFTLILMMRKSAY